MKILIIGASGLLGNSFIRIAGKENEIYGTYNETEIKGDSFFKLDSTKRKEVFDLVEEIQPDIVVDTHAMNNVDKCETNREECWSVNFDGCRHLAEASNMVGAKYVFISSDYVFDGTRMDYIEKDKTNALNYYGKVKRAAEMMLEALDINHLTIRTSGLYGLAGREKGSFVTFIKNTLEKNEKIDILSDQYLTYTYVDNLTDIILKLIKMDERGLFHVSGSDCISKYEFAQKIADTFGLDKNLLEKTSTAKLNQIARRPGRLKLNCNKSERVAKMKAIGVEEGLINLKKQMGELA